MEEPRTLVKGIANVDVNADGLKVIVTATLLIDGMTLDEVNFAAKTLERVMTHLRRSIMRRLKMTPADADLYKIIVGKGLVVGMVYDTRPAWHDETLADIREVVNTTSKTVTV